MTTLTAEYILKIPKDKPEKLFTYDSYIRESKVLLKIWHPDVCDHTDADKVTAHINVLVKVAKEKIAKNNWSINAVFEFISDGTTYRMKYKKHHSFELGDMYIGDTKVIYIIKDEYKKLSDNAINIIANLRYASDKMKQEFQKYVPHYLTYYTANCGQVIVINKTKDLLLLHDVIEHYENHIIPKKHAMWVISSLYNISAFLEFNKITHNAISPMTVFISPEFHSVTLLGGWWYTRKNGEKLLGIPGSLMSLFPKSVIESKLAESKCDRLLIKGTAIKCLGDDTMTGSKLLSSKELPSALVHWLRQPSNKTAVDEYKAWMQILIDTMGPRKFIDLQLTVNDIY
jgi:hypothetical protein